MNTLFYDKTCFESQISNRQINKFFIYDDEIYFHVEKIPMGLNFIDLIRFKNLVSSSIDGFVAKSYKVKEYLIFIYVKYIIKNHKSKVLLIEKVELLKNMINEDIVSELWIIKDTKHKCVGMFNNHPVFFAIFDNNYDVNQSIDTLMNNLNNYSKINTVRFFGCNREDFQVGSLNTIEYSESFIANLIENEKSLDRYCEKNCILNSKMKPHTLGLLCFAVFMNLCSAMMYAVNKQIIKECKDIEMNINNLPRPISKQHYNAIVRAIEKTKKEEVLAWINCNK